MTPENNQIADLLWSQFWQVTVLALVVGIVARVVSRRRPHLAYLLWMLVVVKCVTPPLWSSPAGLFSWAQARRAVASASVPEPEVVEGVGRLSPADSTPPGESAQMRVPPENEAAMGILAPVRREAATVVPLAFLLLVVWLGGAAMLGLIVVAQRIRLLRLVKGSTFAADPGLAALASRAARDLGLRRRVHVVVTKKGITPAVFGVFRPTVLLPESLVRGNSPEELRPLLAHELAHVRRWDCQAGVMQVFAQMVWWFHPLVWWANRRVCEERERCCDEEAVTAAKCRPAHYARALLNVLETKRGLRPVLGLPGMRPVQVTSRRLEDIMKRADRFHARTPRWCWAVMVAVAALVLPGKGLLLGAAAGGSDKPRPANLELKQIVAGVERMHKSIQSMKVRYYREVESDDREPVWPQSWVVFAFKGDKRYLDRTRHEADGDLFRSIAVYDGMVTYELHGALIDANPGRVAPVELDFYTMSLFMTVVEPTGLKRDLETTEQWLPYALRRPGWKLLPDQEQVDGAWCHVLQRHGTERAHQKLWIDANAGFTVRKREFYADGEGKRLKDRWSASKLVPVDKGIWLPKRVLRESFDADSPEKPANYKEEITVEEIAVNNVPDVLFDADALDALPRPLKARTAWNDTERAVTPSKQAPHALNDIERAKAALEKGPVTLVGVVLDPAGRPAPSVTVTLDREWQRNPRYVTTQTNESGFFAIVGPPPSPHLCAVWAATPDGKLGTNWVTSRLFFESRGFSIPEDMRSLLKHQDGQKYGYTGIRLRDGQTTLHVRDVQCNPVPGALVDVFLGGIDDLSQEVPPNIREMLKRKTDDDGIARWPSRLADHDLGFEVTAPGYEVQRRDHYSGLFPERIKVFVLGGDDDDQVRCTEMVKAEIESRNDRNEAGRLTLSDREKVHAICLRARGSLEWQWRVYLPESRDFRLRLVTGEVPKTGVPGPGEAIQAYTPIHRSGEFLIMARVEERSRGTRVLAVTRPGRKLSNPIQNEGWLKRGDWTISGITPGKTQSVAPGTPMVLLRLRVNEEGGAPETPCDGLMIAIEEIETD